MLLYRSCGLVVLDQSNLKFPYADDCRNYSLQQKLRSTLYRLRRSMYLESYPKHYPGGIGRILYAPWCGIFMRFSPSSSCSDIFLNSSATLECASFSMPPVKRKLVLPCLINSTKESFFYLGVMEQQKCCGVFGPKYLHKLGWISDAIPGR